MNLNVDGKDGLYRFPGMDRGGIQDFMDNIELMGTWAYSNFNTGNLNPDISQYPIGGHEDNPGYVGGVAELLDLVDADDDIPFSQRMLPYRGGNNYQFTGESFHPSAYETPRSRWYKYVTVGLGALATAAVGGIRAAGADEAQRASADTGLRPSTSETIAAGESRVAQRNESAAVSVRPESTALAQIDISKTPRL